MGWVSWKQVRGRWRKLRHVAEEPELEPVREPLPVAHVNAA